MIYVTGDMHGQISRFDDPALHKLKERDTLLICGDFGFLWDGSKEEMNQLRKLTKNCPGDGTISALWTAPTRILICFPN